MAECMAGRRSERDPQHRRVDENAARCPPGAGSASRTGAAASGELVTGVLGLVAGRALAGQVGERALDLAPDPADGDAEDALTALEQVDDLVGRTALVDAGAVTHQGDAGQVVGTAL